VTDFGAKGDGVTDDSGAIQRAVAWLMQTHPLTGGTIYFPLKNCAPTTYVYGTPGSWDGSGLTPIRLTPPIICPSNVTFLGDHLPGVGRSTIKLCDNFSQLIHGETYPASHGWQYCMFATASSGVFFGPPSATVPETVHDIVFRNLALDGNSANQPAIPRPNAQQSMPLIVIAPNTQPGAIPIPVSNVLIENCDIGFSPGYALVGTYSWAENVRINKSLMHDAAYVAFGPDGGGTLNGLYVTDTDFFNIGSYCFDFELYVLTLVRIAGCSFNQCGSCAVSLGTQQGVATVHNISNIIIDSCQFGNVLSSSLPPTQNHIFVVVAPDPGRGDSIHIKNCYFGAAWGNAVWVKGSGNGTIENCFFDQSAQGLNYSGKVIEPIDLPQIIFDGLLCNLGSENSGNNYTYDFNTGPPGSNWQVLGCTFKPFAIFTPTSTTVDLATRFPCILAIQNAVNILISGCVCLNNTVGSQVAPYDILFASDQTGGLANHRFIGNSGLLGEPQKSTTGLVKIWAVSWLENTYVPFDGFDVGNVGPPPTLTSIAVGFPVPQTTSQYEVCPQFIWNAGAWWVTDNTAAGYTLNWENSAPAATKLPITIRDALA
jgi:hypothetical protein